MSRIGLSALLPVALSAQWVNYPAAGIPRGPDGKVDLAAPTPRTMEDKPDLAGEGQEFFRDLASGLKPGDVVM